MHRYASADGCEKSHARSRLLVVPLMVLALFLAPTMTSAASSGALICDAINVCNFEVYNYSCPPGMELVAPPVRSDNYSFSVSDGNNSWYTPGMQMDLVLKVLDKDYKYIGTLLYAVDSNEKKVGSWSVLDSSLFQVSPACDDEAVTHTSAVLKNYEEKFRFTAPESGTGDITFRVLLKWGETQGGAFFWPMTAGDLHLKEGPEADREVVWIAADVGDSCDDACSATGQTCDGASLAEAATDADSLYAAVSNDVLCAEPVLYSCDDGAPYVDADEDQQCSWGGSSSLCPSSFSAPSLTPTERCAITVASDDDESTQRLCACSLNPTGVPSVPPTLSTLPTPHPTSTHKPSLIPTDSPTVSPVPSTTPTAVPSPLPTTPVRVRIEMMTTADSWWRIGRDNFNPTANDFYIRYRESTSHVGIVGFDLGGVCPHEVDGVSCEVQEVRSATLRLKTGSQVGENLLIFNSSSDWTERLVGSWNDDETAQLMPPGFKEVALDPEGHADQILDARYNGTGSLFETYTWYEFNVTDHPSMTAATCNAHLSTGARNGNVSFALLTTSNSRTSVRQRDYSNGDAAPTLVLDLELVASSLYGAPSPKPTTLPSSSEPSASPTTSSPTSTRAPSVAPYPSPTAPPTISVAPSPLPTRSSVAPSPSPTAGSSNNDDADEDDGGSNDDVGSSGSGIMGDLSDTEVLVVGLSVGVAAGFCIVFGTSRALRQAGSLKRKAATAGVDGDGSSAGVVALSPIRKHHDNPMRLVDERFATQTHRELPPPRQPTESTMAVAEANSAAYL